MSIERKGGAGGIFENGTSCNELRLPQHFSRLSRSAATFQHVRNLSMFEPLVSSGRGSVRNVCNIFSRQVIDSVNNLNFTVTLVSASVEQTCMPRRLDLFL